MSFTQRARLLGTAVLLIVGICRVSPAQETGQKAASKTNITDKLRVPANLGYESILTGDKQVLTAIFDNLFVELQPPGMGLGGVFGQTMTKTKLAVLQFPYETDLRSVKFNVDVRGFRSVGSGAHARLLLCAGETTKVVNIAVKTGNVDLKGKSKERYKDAKFVEPIGNFQDRIEITVQKHAAKPVCQVTLFLQVDQDTDAAGSGGALLVIDSLDFSFAKSGKTKMK